jgi:lipooligosaccharide transport system permease protein
MQTAVALGTYPVMGAIVWNRLYDAMLATPLRVVDVLVGHLTFVVLRLLVVAAAFGLVGAALGPLRSPWLPVAATVAVLCGVAHAAPVMAYAATLENDQGFALVYRLGVTPMFLFAGTFFPVGQLPGVLRGVAWVTPLWHATDAVRSLLLGRPDLGAVAGHVVYLLVWCGAGVLLARRSYERRLVR